MALLSPWFLAGALAVGLPLWLHLLQRENPVKLRISSLMFFEKRTQSTIRERRFRHLLLLALRLALLLLLALAFAKPIWERPPAVVAGDIPSLHVIALDTSLSMQHSDRWTRAREAANGIIDSPGRRRPGAGHRQRPVGERRDRRNRRPSRVAQRRGFAGADRGAEQFRRRDRSAAQSRSQRGLSGRGASDLRLPEHRDAGPFQRFGFAGDGGAANPQRRRRCRPQLGRREREGLQAVVRRGPAEARGDRRRVRNAESQQAGRAGDRRQTDRGRNRRNSGERARNLYVRRFRPAAGASAARSSSSSRPTISRPTTAAWRRWTMPSPIRCFSSAPTTASATCSITAPRWGPPPALASRWSRPRRAKPSGSTPSGMR